MTRTIYEAYNDTMIVQFLDEAEAQQYAADNNMQFRSVEQEYEETTIRQLTTYDWLALEQQLYQNPSVLAKASNSTGNGFAFLLKVLSDGKTTGASENALQLAINMLIPAMNVPFTESEIAYINTALENNGFQTRI